jgi:hypothetical protein
VSDPTISDPSQLGGLEVKHVVGALSYLRDRAEDFIRWLHRIATDDELVAIVRADLGLSAITPGTAPQLTSAQRERVDEIVESGLERDQQLGDLNEEELAAARLAAKEQLVQETATAQAFADLVIQVSELVEIITVFKAAYEDDAVSERDVLMLLFGPFATGLLEARVPAGHGIARLLGLLIGEHHEVIDAIDVTGWVSPFDERDPDEDEATFVKRSDQRMQRLARAVAVLVSIVDAMTERESGDDRFIAFSGWDPEPTDDPRSVAIAERAVTFTLPLDLGAGVQRPLITLVFLTSTEGGPGVLLTVSGGWTYDRGPAFRFSAETNGAATLVITGDGSTALGNAELLLRAEGRSDPARTTGILLGKPAGSRLVVAHYGWRAGVAADTGRWFVGAQLLGVRLVLDLTEGNAFLRSLAGKRIELEADVEFVVDDVDGPRFRGGSGAAVRLPLRRTAFGFFVLQYLELRTTFDDVSIQLAAGVTFDFGFLRASLDRIGFTYRASTGEDPAGFGALGPPSGIGLEVDTDWVSGGGSLLLDIDAGEYSGALQLRVNSWSINAIGLLTTKEPGDEDGTTFLVLLFLEFVIPLGGDVSMTGLGGVYAHDRQLDTDALGAGVRSGALDDLLFPENPVANAPRLLARYRQLFPARRGTRVAGVAIEISFGTPATATLRLAVMAEWGDRETDGKEWLLVGALHVELPPRDLHSRPYFRLIVEVIGVIESSRGRIVIRGGLRDSFVGTQHGPRFTLTGEFCFVRWRLDPDDPDSATSWLGTIGGWHPDFQLVPPQAPAALQRFGSAVKLGPVSMSLTGYFAFTPETYQFGFDFQIAAKLGPARIEGRLTLDALVDRETDQFTAIVLFKASVRIWGRGLSVEVKGTLAGPSLWRFQGSATVSILWKSFEIDIDVESGSLPGVVEEVVDAIGDVVLALESPTSRRPTLPPRTQVVTLTDAGSGAIDELAHPLGTISISQTIAPFGVRIDRIGERRLASGPATLRVESVVIGDDDITEPVHTRGQFALGQYTTMSNEERLARRSFDQLVNGVTVGGSDFVVPATFRDVEIDHETKRVNAEPEPVTTPWTVISRGRIRYAVHTQIVTHGAGGRSAAARAAALVAARSTASTSEPPMVVVSAADLHPVASFIGDARRSPTLARAAVAGQTAVLVVPEFEVVDGGVP